MINPYAPGTEWSTWTGVISVSFIIKLSPDLNSFTLPLSSDLNDGYMVLNVSFIFFAPWPMYTGIAGSTSATSPKWSQWICEINMAS
ncbi:MAG: hypothetical protein BWY84_01136 [Candidatus Aerophobetes bacterium ADurb.Bin490]|nr:MAG: hypothetical protein BWY84_01136 [Candidatus Aerophobetes bacterium ADurb.Bin490]